MWIYQHANFKVYQLPVLNDNYIYLVEDCHSNSVLVIDPALAQPVQEICAEHKLIPTHILNTHHHWDHTDGNLELVENYHCSVIGNQADAARIRGISQPIMAGDSLKIGNLDIQILEVYGHTLGHIAFVIDDALFCGDTLFGAGCGRLFEGSYSQMWQSLQLLANLPETTKVYCAHEYTLANLAFAQSIDADNLALQQRITSDEEQRRLLQPTIPSTIALEKETNPFLRPLHREFIEYFNSQRNQEWDALHIFQAIRELRNTW